MPRTISTVPFSRIRREPVRWLWRGRIPLAKATMLEGDGGAGKSSLITWLAAGASRGDLDGDLAGEPATVILFNAEDGAGDTIRPRLEAQGGDLDLVHALDEERDTTITFPDDLETLRQLIIRTQAKLVVFDPIASFLAPKVTLTSDTGVRRALGPLKRIAEDTGAAIVLIRHLNGQRNAPAYRRGLGGAALSNVVRMVWVVALDPDDGDDPSGRRIIAYVKGNPDGRITTSIEMIRDEAGRITIGSEVAITSNELLRQQHSGAGRRQPSRTDAIAWLREFLDGREVSTNEVNEEAAARLISARTLDRARSEVGVLHRRVEVRNADGTSTHATMLRLPEYVIVEAPAADPLTPVPADASSGTAAVPTFPNAGGDDAITRFSLLELDAVGRVGGAGNAAPINGNETAIPGPPSPPADAEARP